MAFRRPLEQFRRLALLSERNEQASRRLFFTYQRRPEFAAFAVLEFIAVLEAVFCDLRMGLSGYAKRSSFPGLILATCLGTQFGHLLATAFCSPLSPSNLAASKASKFKACGPGPLGHSESPAIPSSECWEFARRFLEVIRMGGRGEYRAMAGQITVSARRS